MSLRSLDPSIFPQFLRLPVELRIQIWRQALPNMDRLALYFLRNECWKLEWIHCEHEEMSLTFGFHGELLSPIQIDIPLAFVNHEARQACLLWIHEQGMEVRFCKERQRLVFTCPFDENRDVVYLHDSDDFDFHPYNILYPLDIEERSVSIFKKTLRLAVPEKLLRTELEKLVELVEWFTVITLFVIVDSPPDLHLEPDTELQRWWQLKDSGRDALAWDLESSRFDLRPRDGQDSVSRHMDQINQLLGPGLSRWKHEAFEIRPVLAIRK